MLSTATIFALAAQCAPAVAPETMYAVIATESQGNPFAIGVNSGDRLARQPRTFGEAVTTAKMLLARGTNIDLGLGQINSANMEWLKLSVEEAFDPCENIKASAQVLSLNYKAALAAGKEMPLGAALSAYNTGSMTKGYRNGYVAKVFKNAPSAKSRGNWTPSAVGKLLVSQFGGRITDAERPWNAGYGADNSYHKYGQAVDFVPDGGVGSISKSEIEDLMNQHGVQLIELLGPGDPEHHDHFHVAFALETSGATASEPPATNDDGAQQLPVAEPEPPRWDVFAHAAWRNSQTEQDDTDG